MRLAGQELLVVPAESWGVIDFYLNWSARLTGEVAIITTLAKVKTGPRMSIVGSDRHLQADIPERYR